MCFLESRARELTAYKAFAIMVHTQFDSSICVFPADSTGEYLSRSLRQFLSEQGTLFVWVSFFLSKVLFLFGSIDDWFRC
jgi:hypothetical protein